MPRKNLIVLGSRPSSAALARTAEVYFLRDGRVGFAQKMASACLPPNSIPALEEPAWKSTGVRCGDGWVWWKACILWYLPS